MWNFRQAKRIELTDESIKTINDISVGIYQTIKNFENQANKQSFSFNSKLFYQIDFNQAKISYSKTLFVPLLNKNINLLIGFINDIKYNKNYGIAYYLDENNAVILFNIYNFLKGKKGFPLIKGDSPFKGDMKSFIKYSFYHEMIHIFDPKIYNSDLMNKDKNKDYLDKEFEYEALIGSVISELKFYIQNLNQNESKEYIEKWKKFLRNPDNTEIPEPFSDKEKYYYLPYYLSSESKNKKILQDFYYIIDKAENELNESLISAKAWNFRKYAKNRIHESKRSRVSSGL